MLYVQVSIGKQLKQVLDLDLDSNRIGFTTHVSQLFWQAHEAACMGVAQCSAAYCFLQEDAKNLKNLKDKYTI